MAFAVRDPSKALEVSEKFLGFDVEPRGTVESVQKWMAEDIRTPEEYRAALHEVKRDVEEMERRRRIRGADGA
jgi:hypothetical protein